MLAHRIETTILPGGTIAVHGLPLADGAEVEVIVLVKDPPRARSYPLRGTPYRFDDPTEPAVPPDQWAALR